MNIDDLQLHVILIISIVFRDHENKGLEKKYIYLQLRYIEELSIFRLSVNIDCFARKPSTLETATFTCGTCAWWKIIVATGSKFSLWPNLDYNVEERKNALADRSAVVLAENSRSQIGRRKRRPSLNRTISSRTNYLDRLSVCYWVPPVPNGSSRTKHRGRKEGHAWRRDDERGRRLARSPV